MRLLNTAITSADGFNTETSVFVLKGTKAEVYISYEKGTVQYTGIILATSKRFK